MWSRILTLIGGLAASCVAAADDDREELQRRFEAAKTSVGDKYVVARKELLERPGVDDFLKQPETISSSNTLAEVLSARLAHGEEFEKLEQEFRSKTLLFYWRRPQAGIVHRPLPRTLEGLLIPGEKSPYDLDPKDVERTWGDNADKIMRPYFESVRVSESPLWGLFCCEIAIKGWVPAGTDGPREELGNPLAIRHSALNGPSETESPIPSSQTQQDFDRDRRDQIVCQAISLLGKLDERRGGPLLQKVLEDKNATPSKRGAAALAIGRLQYKESLPALIERCQITARKGASAAELSDVLFERSGVMRALAMLKDRSAIPALQKIIDTNMAWAQGHREVVNDSKTKRLPPSERHEHAERSRHTEEARHTIAEIEKNE